MKLMDLSQWWRGLESYFGLFNNKATAVRLYCADGQVLYEIYENNRQEGDLALNKMNKKNKKKAAQDFFRAVREEIFQDTKFNPGIKKKLPISIFKIAKQLDDSYRCCGKRDYYTLPLCFFVASIWSTDFKDENDPSPNSYRKRFADSYRKRFDEALRWGSDGNETLEYDPRDFSDGIETLFDLLARQYSGKIYMPPKDFKYGSSSADGITISHSIFRYGEIANIYTAFSDKKLIPHLACEDTTIFNLLADKYFDKAWMNWRHVDAETLAKAIEKLYYGWDGESVENYRYYIRENSECTPPTRKIQMTNSHCKAYWSLIPDRFNQFRIGICLDKISGCSNGIVAGNGEREVTITVAGTSCYKWLENGDRWTDTPGWINLKSEDEILFKDGDTKLDSITSFNKCFDGHAVILLQSYVPPSGGNPIWRLMVGGQGIELWGGDARPKNPQYAIMAPRALKDGDVQCAGKDHIDELGSLNVMGKVYHVYRLCGDLRGALIVNDFTLFNFGIPHDLIDAKEYFSEEKLDVHELNGDDFVAPPRPTVFYLPDEKKIAVYCPLNVDRKMPILYVVSENDIRSCGIDPSLNRHQCNFTFDDARRFWITTEELDDPPYVIGLPSKDRKEISFVALDADAVDYHNSWKGYFLPKMDDKVIVTGALTARWWLPNIHNVLRSSKGGDTSIAAEEGFSSLTNLLEDVRINDAEEKLSFIKDIGSMLLTKVVTGITSRKGFGCFRNTFLNIPQELNDFLNCISRGQMRSLKEYFVWALVLLSIHCDRVGVEKRLKSNDEWNKYKAFRRTLKEFEPTTDPRYRSKYCPYFVCEGIVHAVLDGVDNEKAQQIVLRGVALADSLVSSLI